MGQYYNIVLQEKGKKKIHAYDRQIDGEYTMAKLMEHSWLLNDMVNAIMEKLYNNPCRIAWIGDYADESDLYQAAWNNGDKYEMLHNNDFNFMDKYIINHSKKLILRVWDYMVDCVRKTKEDKDWGTWVIHPLPLLVAIGNGRGGGDYRGVNADRVGEWAWDMLEVVNWDKAQELADKKKYQQFKIYFTEEPA